MSDFEKSPKNAEDYKFPSESPDTDKKIYGLGEGGIKDKEHKQPDLIQAMQKRGWNQRKTANYLGISEQSLGSWLKNERVPSEFSSELEKKFLDLTGKLPQDLFTRPEKSAVEFVSFDKAVRRELDDKVAKQFVNSELSEQEKHVFQRELAEAISESARDLSPTQKDVIKLRFGLGVDGVEHTLRKVAEILNIKTEERIRQIQSKALRILRHPRTSRRLEKFIE